MIEDFPITEVFCRERFDIEPCLVEYLCQLSKESSLISECHIHLDRDTLSSRTTPLRRDTPSERDTVHVLTVESVDRDDPLPYSSYDPLTWFRMTAESHLVRDIALFPDDDIVFSATFCFFSCGFFLFFCDRFFFSEKFAKTCIIDRPEYTRRLTREIPELYEDVFFVLRIEGFSIEVFQKGELLIESLSIVALEIGIEDESSFFDKKTSLFAIDKLSDMLTSFLSLDEGEPCGIGLSVRICDDLYALTIVEDIVEWDDLTIYLCDRELISDFAMDRIGEVDGCRTFRKGDDVSLRCEYEYLV